MTHAPPRRGRLAPRASRRRASLVAFIACGLAGLWPLAADTTPSPDRLPAVSLLAQPSDGPAPLTPFDPHLPHPGELLGAPIGERFQPQHRLLDVLEILAAASPRVHIEGYGSTPEERPLSLVTISAPRHLARLDEIFAAHRALARGEIEPGTDLNDLPAVIWLAFGIHGDEPSPSETAVALTYALAAVDAEPVAANTLGEPTDDTLALQRVLDRLVVVVDPVANPDGRARHVEWLRAWSGRRPDPAPQAAEHMPPWPGGRGNHDFVDLNRDWAFLSQPETRARLQVLQRQEPLLLVDFHEMGAGGTYFFPPPAEPIHPGVEAETRRWLEVFGRGNAAAFDRHGWSFFVRDVYDFFFPGYSDTYMTLRGGLGMTYEMAGGSTSGIAIDRGDGDLLTLADRVARHYVAAVATLDTAASRRDELIESALERGRAKRRAVYVFAGRAPEARALAELLDDHGFAVRRLREKLTLPALRLDVPRWGERRFAAGDWVVESSGRATPLLETLIEHKTPLDSAVQPPQGLEQEIEHYDITAWSLPLAFGVDAWRLDLANGTDRLANAPVELAWRQVSPCAPIELDPSGGSRGPGWVLPPRGVAGYRSALQLLHRGVRLRRVTGTDGGAAERGAFLVPRRRQNGELAELLIDVARTDEICLERLESSWPTEGTGLGSERVRPLRLARIGVAAGVGVDPVAHGHLWSLLDAHLDARPSRRLLAGLDRRRLADLDVFVLPDGATGNALDFEDAQVLEDWTRAGGTLIGLGRAADWLRRQGLLSVELRGADPVLEPAENTERPAARPAIATPSADDAFAITAVGFEDSEPPLDLPTFVAPPIDPPLPAGAGVEDEFELEPSPDLLLPGVVVAARVATDHPLAAGMPKQASVLLTGGPLFEPASEPGLDLLTVRAIEPVLAGLVPDGRDDLLAGAVLATERPLGDGRIVAFTYDPAFRLFWRATMPLFLEAAVFRDIRP